MVTLSCYAGACKAVVKGGRRRTVLNRFVKRMVHEEKPTRQLQVPSFSGPPSPDSACPAPGAASAHLVLLRLERALVLDPLYRSKGRMKRLG
jgi:hypothetical protein